MNYQMVARPIVKHRSKSVKIGHQTPLAMQKRGWVGPIGQRFFGRSVRCRHALRSPPKRCNGGMLHEKVAKGCIGEAAWIETHRGGVLAVRAALTGAASMVRAPLF
jgi:hypothetical protein